MSERRKVCKTALTNTYTGPILLTLWPLVCECVGAHTYTRTCLYEGHDDNCAESILLAAVVVAVESRWRNKVENQKKNCSTTSDYNKCCRQIQILSTTLAVCCSFFVQERTLFLFNSQPCGPGCEGISDWALILFRIQLVFPPNRNDTRVSAILSLDWARTFVGSSIMHVGTKAKASSLHRTCMHHNCLLVSHSLKRHSKKIYYFWFKKCIICVIFLISKN